MNSENIVEKAQKKEEELQRMLEELLQELEDKRDILYSRRCRGQVTRIIDWMLMHDYVYDDDACVVYSNEDISLLRKAISYMSMSIRDSLRMLHLPTMYNLFERFLFYPVADLNLIHLEPDFVNSGNVIGITQGAFFPMGRCERSVMMDSEAHSIMSLLESTPLGCDLNTFRDKYVLVCRINVPAAFKSCDIQSLFNLCHELCSLERGDIEIVIVARTHILCDSPWVFQEALKGLPSSCHIVPYEDWQNRERICKQIGFGTGELECFVYNTDGLFLNTFYANVYDNPYGAEAFPFTKDMVEKVDGERVALRWGGSLEELLRPSYQDYQEEVVVYEFNERDGPKRPISQVIENMHVGLYVCCEGDLIPRLHELYEQCKQRKEEFEIVVLYLPLLTNVDPETFRQEMDSCFLAQKIRGWWCLPFNNSISLRFWGLTKDYYLGEDRLIIVGTDGKILDMYGAEVIKSHGIYGTYPFTRNAFVEKRMRELRSKDGLLDSLFEAPRLFRGTNPRDVISGNELVNKKVIIFIGCAPDSDDDFEYGLFKMLVSQYEKMKEDVGDEFEVVFVEVPIERGADDASVFNNIPWYVHCPLDGSYTALSQSKDLAELDNAMVGFDKEGRICSVKQMLELGSYKTDGVCLENTLFDDLHVFYAFDQFRVI